MLKVAHIRLDPQRTACWLAAVKFRDAFNAAIREMPDTPFVREAPERW